MILRTCKPFIKKKEVRNGVVVNVSGKNTIRILVNGVRVVKKYLKSYKVRRYLLVHCVNTFVRVGCIVEIVKVNPISRLKHWVLYRIMG